MPTIGPSAPFVGRKQEIDFLREWLTWGGTLVLVSGEAGIGKSRLVEEFVASAAAEGLVFLQGRCYEGMPPAPFLPILELFAAKQGISDTDAVAEDLARALKLPRTSEISAGSGDARLQFYSRLASRLLEPAGDSRIVLVIDDLQWIDPDSLLFLSYLLDSSGGAVSVLATRRDPCPGPENLALEAFERRAHRLELQPLTRGDSAALASRARPDLGVGDEARLYELSGGNPLFLLELLHQGAPDGRALTSLRPGEAAPRSLAGYLDKRLEGLSHSTLSILADASVIGWRFDPFLLSLALEISQRDIEIAIDEAHSLGIVFGRRDDIQSTFEFAHPLFRERLYQRLDAKRRRYMHGRLGRLPRTHIRHLTLEQVAIHRALGFEEDEREEAIASCRAAAESAERMLAYQSAVELWRLALTCESEAVSLRRADLLHRMALACRAFGNWDEAIPALRRAYELYEVLDDHAAAGSVALYLGELYRFRLEMDEAHFWLLNAVRKELSRDDKQKVLALLSSTHALRGEHTLAEEVLHQALQIAPVRNADVAFWSSFTLSLEGRLDEAREMSVKGLEAATASGDSAYTALHAGSLAQMELARLDTEACERYVAIVEEHSSIVDTISLVRALLCRSLLESLRGNWLTVVEVCERWQSQVKKAGVFQVAVARMVLAEALSALGRDDEAVFHAQEAIPHLGNNKNLGNLHLARMYSRAGDLATAREILSKAVLPMLTRERASGGRTILADLVELIEDDDLVCQLYEALTAEPRKISAVYTPVSLSRIKGKLAGRMRLWKESFAHFDVAIQELSAARAMAELAQTYRDYAAARRRRSRRGDPLKAVSLEAAARHASGQRDLPPEEYDGGLPNRFGLTPREMDVLRLVAQGRRNSEIAEALYVSTHTVDRHIENIFGKLEVRNRTEAVLRAAEEGIVFDLAKL